MKLTIIKADFIDDIPNSSLDNVTDSDNYFLREELSNGNMDHEDLDIS